MLQREKLTVEKEEISKALLKIQNREAQYLHDMRKKELTLQNFQEQLKKYQKEKNIQYLNTINLPNPLLKAPSHSGENVK